MNYFLLKNWKSLITLCQCGIFWIIVHYHSIAFVSSKECLSWLRMKNCEIGFEYLLQNPDTVSFLLGTKCRTTNIDYNSSTVIGSCIHILFRRFEVLGCKTFSDQRHNVLSYVFQRIDLQFFSYFLFYGKQRQARTWNAICRCQQQYDNMVTEY